MYYNDDDICLGCSQKAFHKYCPAHGTKFYMSGVPYTNEIHAMRKINGVDFVNAIYTVLKLCQKHGIKVGELSPDKPAEE